MFGLSPTKLLVLMAIIGVIFYGPRLLRQLERMLNRGAGDDDGPAAIDSRKCPQCGNYVIPSEATDCGQKSCPYA